MNLVFLVLTFFFITGCAQQSSSAMDERLRQQALASATSDFERLCYQNGHMWMSMPQYRNGVPVDDDSCYGCMPNNDNHLCDMQEYTEYVKQR